MPISEYREVRFDASALRAAIQARLQDARAVPQNPPATVLSATVTRADPVQVTAEMGTPEGAQRGTIVMEAVEVAAALIRTCMQRGIRLPRSGAKTLKAMHGGVALVVTVSHTEGAPGRPHAA